jgi:WD40 repeat protein
MLEFHTGHCVRNGLQFTADGRRLMVVSGWPTLYDTLGSDPPHVLKPPDGSFAPHATLVRGGAALAYVAARNVHIWDYTTGGEVVIPDAAPHLSDLAVSPDGTTLYAACCTQDGSHNRCTQLLAFDAATGAPKGTFSPARGSFVWLSMSADGRRLAGRGAYDVCAWGLTDPSSPDSAVTMKIGGSGKYVGCVALSADGTKLVVLSTRGVQLWDLATRPPAEIFRSGKHKRRATAAACSPTRPLIATADTAGQVFMWDHTGRVLNRYDWGLGEVVAACFSPDGLRCAAADNTGKLVVWDVDV